MYDSLSGGSFFLKVGFKAVGTGGRTPSTVSGKLTPQSTYSSTVRTVPVFCGSSSRAFPRWACSCCSSSCALNSHVAEVLGCELVPVWSGRPKLGEKTHGPKAKNFYCCLWWRQVVAVTAVHSLFLYVHHGRPLAIIHRTCRRVESRGGFASCRCRLHRCRRSGFARRGGTK